MAARTATTLSAEEALSVSVVSLIKLAYPARQLSLRHGEIRSHKSDVVRSRMKGRGMEYDESRLYQPGDDIRHLDWRVTARTGKAHTKLFCEERERPVFLFVDCRAPMFFATRGRLKTVVAAETAALLAWSAVHEGDRVGGVVFSERFHSELKPKRGRASVLRLLHELVACGTIAPDDSGRVAVPGADAGARCAGIALSHLSQLVHPGSLVFFISDFRNIDGAGESLMRQLAVHNEVFFILVFDPVERQLPPPGDYRVSDGSQELRFNTADAGFAQAYEARFIERLARWQGAVSKTGSGFLQCHTSEVPFDVLKRNFPARRSG